VFVWFLSLSIQKFTSVATYSPGEEREGPFPGLSPNLNFYCVQNIPKEDPFSYSALTHEILLSTHTQISDKKTVEVRPLPPVRCPGQYATANAGHPVHAEPLARTAHYASISSWVHHAPVR